MSLSKLATMFREEVRAKIGQRADLIARTGEPSLDELLEYFGDGPGVATALGLGRPGQYTRDANYPKYRARKNFLDSFARQRRLGRDPFNRSGQGQRDYGPRLRRVVQRERDRQATPATQRAVLELMEAHGVTVNKIAGELYYDVDRPERDFIAKVFVKPHQLARYGFSGAIRPIDWGKAALAFLGAWGAAYGLDDEFTEEGGAFTVLDFELGKGYGVDYDFD